MPILSDSEESASGEILRLRSGRKMAHAVKRRHGPFSFSIFGFWVLVYFRVLGLIFEFRRLGKWMGEFRRLGVG